MSNITMQKTERDAIIEHSTQIKHLVHDPSSFLTEITVQQQQYHCLKWLFHFDILSCIPLPPSAVAYADIAAKAQVPVSTLRSVARMAITTGLLRETADGKLSHTPLSVPFVENIHFRTLWLFMFNHAVPIMGALIPATEKWGKTKAPNETAYNIVHNTDLPYFKHLKTQPDLSNDFDLYMKSKVVAHMGSSAQHLLEAFDWNSIGGAMVVDVGGGSGTTAIMLATMYPKLNLIIQDLPGPISNARSQVLTLSEDIKSRVSPMEHDFFTAQPVKGADIYLLRTIIHDWPDADAIKILRGISEAMTPSSRLLIMDMVLPKPGSGPITFEAALRQKDMNMIQTFNAKERELDEWTSLLIETDPRFSITAIRRPEGSELSVIEVTLGKESRPELTASLNGYM